MRFLLLALISIMAQPIVSRGAAPPDGNDLKLLITVEQQVLTAPFPARVTLHLHNSGKKTLWLYRPVTASRPDTGDKGSETPQGSSDKASHSIEGSTLAVRLEGGGQGAENPGQGEILDTVGMPRPKLVRLDPGDDLELNTALHLTPAQAGTKEKTQALWGRYKLVVTYTAKYSNAAELERILGATAWQGEVESNSVELELQPPLATAIGNITGTVVNPTNVPLDGILVSLSDREERLLNQAATDIEGKYSFSQLPPGVYWVTIRRKDATEDTAIFRHIVLAPAEPAGSINFVLTAPEVFEPKQMMHKPVLFLVVDGSGAPIGNVGLESTWSSGTVLDSVKGVTSADGLVPLELIPGANYVTLKRHGCPKYDEKINITDGRGIDDSKIVYDCSKK
ncbi:MAG TPA: carboxypeptidase-like regulatory domain-containing protein [Terriglobia bacterium]|nr:carboxypeptidase-like regulatory domain-containing protein [Terriglobia bacterium]